jgi:CheY-like chemotaxis protein
MSQKVLLIDDEEGFTRLLKMNLEKSGKYQVMVENNSMRAHSTARSFRPDVILLDVVMPGLDGGDLLARFNDDPDLHRVPVIMLTALVSRGDTGTQAVAQSANLNVLPKPVDLAMLTRVMDEALAQH